jgi:hypothetical protein
MKRNTDILSVYRTGILPASEANTGQDARSTNKLATASPSCGGLEA